MKSTLYSLTTLVLLAVLGSFLGLWRLPYQQAPYTYHDLTQDIKGHFAYDDDLRDARDNRRTENEEIFRKKK